MALTRSEESELQFAIEELRNNIIEAFDKNDYNVDYYLTITRGKLQDLAQRVQAQKAKR